MRRTLKRKEGLEQPETKEIVSLSQVLLQSPDNQHQRLVGKRRRGDQGGRDKPHLNEKVLIIQENGNGLRHRRSPHCDCL